MALKDYLKTGLNAVVGANNPLLGFLFGQATGSQHPLYGGNGSLSNAVGGAIPEGFAKPNITQIDPTPEALKPMQQMIIQMLMQRMQGGGPNNQQTLQQGLPNFGSIHQQLYGGGMPGMSRGPNTQLPNIPMGLPTYGQVSSGSRSIRSMQPYRRV